MAPPTPKVALTKTGTTTFGRMCTTIKRGVDIPASATNWMHVSVPINAASDPNLANIYNVILHIYGPYYTPMSGSSTCWRRQRVRSAIDTARLALPWPTTCLSSSETISDGVMFI